MPEIRDAAQRARVLDSTRSFIVQAPAGSGKTELLIQRYLALLSRVEDPESVVAITFTRKAAGEMRRRVLDALGSAAGPEPTEPHRAETWRLSRAVCEHDAARGWDLVQNASRLRVRTIDSLCDSLVRRMPWLSRLGAPPEIVEIAAGLYEEAARRTIDLVEDSAHGAALARVLMHLDNDYAALTEFLTTMLARRDQWLRHLAGVEDATAARAVLEGGMQRVIQEALSKVRDAAPADFAEELCSLARYAAANVDGDHAIAACAGLHDLPGDLPAWLGIAELLLTQSETWRKTVDKRLGFPPASRAEKNRFQELLTAIQLHDAFRLRLSALRSLPPAVFDEAQWEVLAALIPVLKLAAAQLHLVFQERGQSDFTGIALAALTALGAEGEPTDLALALDYRIQHLLVDEFQDTSVTQFALIERLVAGWEPGDGRTLFLVGDPMQSIFRFREAEVGLFFEAARNGMGPVRLERVQLEMNFRSEQGIVAWVNEVFEHVIGADDDIATGAVGFASSAAMKPAGAGPAISVHPFFDKNDEAEAARVVEIVRASRAAEAKVAVLVRARTHLPSILPALRRAGLKCRAVEIDELGEVAIIQDLLALTRALLHPADRVAWLAILRAPWCGLTLADLHTLAADAHKDAIWDLLHDSARVERLSEDGQARLERVLPVLEEAVARRGARLRPWIEGCWTALGGPACASEPGELENALAFLDLLENLDEGGDTSIEDLAEEVGRMFAAPDPEADDSLQVMSIHKAKGLEFDVVIVPGLGRSVRSDEPRLLAWLERSGDLLLAPVKAAGTEKDQLCEHVKSIEKQKCKNEEARLLYVAATRAVRQLHLLGSAARTDHGLKAGGLLTHLWKAQAVQGDFARAERALPPPTQRGAAAARIPPAPLRRLPSGWSLPAPPPSVRAETGAELPAEESPTFEWVGDTLRHIGTVVHQLFAQIARDGSAAWDRGPAIETALRTLGVPASEIAGAAATVRRALAATLANERGRWILDKAHTEAHSEFPLIGLVDGHLRSVRVDRTFVDAEGVRWIVDFKTSEHAGGDLEGFLDAQREKYRSQMAAYRALFSRMDPRPIRMGLYFPLFAGWREYLEAATA
ncbi:MAG: UvrD-helicase domain-containing protein [Bryobacteraceae bacterium]|jgi:ATP-dependent exoDNAse (exonuclease V) beta subunit